MKKIFIILLLLPVFSYTQTVDTCFTEQEIHDISETLDSLYYLDSVNNDIIIKQETLISSLEHLNKLDSSRKYAHYVKSSIYHKVQFCQLGQHLYLT